MKKIYLGGINAETQEAPNSDISFSLRLREHGYILTKDIKEADLFVAVDSKAKEIKEVLRLGFPKSRCILIKNEPVVVCPDNRSSRIRNKYGLILDIGRPPTKSQNSIPWPQQWPKSLINLNFALNKLDRVALINGNKISFIAGELYSLRREAILELNSLDLYGTGWNLSIRSKTRHAIANFIIAIKGGYLPRISGARYYFKKFLNWKGAPIDKEDTLSQYKFCLVIENSLEFITEKLFDAFFAGCIPIYVGPDLQEFPIPENLYIQAEPTLDSITDSLNRARQLDYSAWSSEITKWLNLESTKENWSSEMVVSRVIDTLKKYGDNLELEVKSSEND